MHFAPCLKRVACGMGGVFLGSILEQGLLFFVYSSCWLPWRFAEFNSHISPPDLIPFLCGRNVSHSTFALLLSPLGPSFVSPQVAVRAVCVAVKGQVSAQPLRTAASF